MCSVRLIECLNRTKRVAAPWTAPRVRPYMSACASRSPSCGGQPRQTARTRARDRRHLAPEHGSKKAHHSTAIEGNTLVLLQARAAARGGPSRRATRNFASTWRCAVTPTPPPGSTARRSRPGEWSSGELLALTELRHVHRLALTPVWDVAPLPSADREGASGSFRQHDIDRFPEGCVPQTWPEVPACSAIGSPRSRALSRPESVATPKRSPDRMPASSRSTPFRRQRPRGQARAEPDACPARLSAGDHLQGRAAHYFAALERADRNDPVRSASSRERTILDNLHKFVVPADRRAVSFGPFPPWPRPNLRQRAARRRHSG